MSVQKLIASLCYIVCVLPTLNKTYLFIYLFISISFEYELERLVAVWMLKYKCIDRDITYSCMHLYFVLLE